MKEPGRNSRLKVCAWEFETVTSYRGLSAGIANHAFPELVKVESPRVHFSKMLPNL